MIPELYPIPDERYAGYRVTRCGKVWSDKSKRFLKGWVYDDRYLRVEVGGRRVPVHTLIALAFHGPRPSPKHLILHGDDDASNNHADNLRYGTSIENHEDSVRNGRRRLSSHTEEVRQLVASGLRLAEAARRVGISYKKAQNAVRNQASTRVVLSRGACRQLPPEARPHLEALAAMDPKFQTLLEWTQC